MDKAIWNKTAEELTVGESVKIQVVVLAVMAGGTALTVGGLVAYEKLRMRLHNRKNKPTLELIQEED